MCSIYLLKRRTTERYICVCIRAELSSYRPHGSLLASARYPLPLSLSCKLKVFFSSIQGIHLSVWFCAREYAVAAVELSWTSWAVEKKKDEKKEKTKMKPAIRKKKGQGDLSLKTSAHFSMYVTHFVKVLSILGSWLTLAISSRWGWWRICWWKKPTCWRTDTSSSSSKSSRLERHQRSVLMPIVSAAAAALLFDKISPIFRAAASATYKSSKSMQDCQNKRKGFTCPVGCETCS